MPEVFSEEVPKLGIQSRQFSKRDMKRGHSSSQVHDNAEELL